MYMYVCVCFMIHGMVIKGSGDPPKVDFYIGQIDSGRMCEA